MQLQVWHFYSMWVWGALKIQSLITLSLLHSRFTFSKEITWRSQSISDHTGPLASVFLITSLKSHSRIAKNQMVINGQFYSAVTESARNVSCYKLIQVVFCIKQSINQKVSHYPQSKQTAHKRAFLTSLEPEEVCLSTDHVTEQL